MTFTVEIYQAVTDIARASRNVITDKAARRIAKAFGYTPSGIGVVYEQQEPGIDYGRRLETWGSGKGVATFTLAWRLADKLSPGWSEGIGYCPYSGAGKSADWSTHVALDAIKAAVDWPNLYVREQRGPDKPAPKRPGETGNWTILGSGEILGYEIVEYDQDSLDRLILATYSTEEAALEAMVALVNDSAPDDL